MATANQTIVDLLNEVLCAELTAINQYFLHSEILADRGYERLHRVIRKDSIDEMKHAEQCIERILFLKGLPNVQKLGNIRIGETVPEMLQSDMALEKEAIARLRKGIAACRDAGDEGTRQLLDSILSSEEEHHDWLETQLRLIEELELTAYLAQQIKVEE